MVSDTRRIPIIQNVRDPQGFRMVLANELLVSLFNGFVGESHFLAGICGPQLYSVASCSDCAIIVGGVEAGLRYIKKVTPSVNRIGIVNRLWRRLQFRPYIVR